MEIDIGPVVYFALAIGVFAAVSLIIGGVVYLLRLLPGLHELKSAREGAMTGGRNVGSCPPQQHSLELQSASAAGAKLTASIGPPRRE